MNSARATSTRMNSDRATSTRMNSARATSTRMNSDRATSTRMNSARATSTRMNSDRATSTRMNSDRVLIQIRKWGGDRCVTQPFPDGGLGCGVSPGETHFGNNFLKIDSKSDLWAPSTPLIPIR